MNRRMVLLAVSSSLIWNIGWLTLAWSRYRNEVRCLWFYGPWLPCGNTDWLEPAVLSLVPLVLLFGWSAWRVFKHLFRCSAPG